MKYDCKYQSGARSLEPDFGRVINATDGGYERGYAQGYTEGETAANAAAEAHNAAILNGCNAVLPEKGVEPAGSLEQVPQRIGEIEYSPNPLLYVTKTNTMYSSVVFPDGYELQIVAPNHQGNMQNMFNGSKGIRKITIDVPTDVGCDMYGFARECDVDEIVLTDGIHITSWNYFTYSCYNLKRVIGRIDLSGNTSNTMALNNRANLEEIYFMPGTIEMSLNINGSPNLIAESIQSIIDGLADLTGQTAQTLTLHATVGAKLTEEQKEAIAAKNWTLAY